MSTRKERLALDKIADPAIRADYISQAVKVCLDTVKQEGIKALESTKWTTAVHESGHAVGFAVTADGQQWAMPYRLKIWREPNPLGIQFWSGCTDVPPGSPPISFDTRTAPPDVLMVYAIRMLAGVVAEYLFAPEPLSSVSSLDEVLLACGIASAFAKRGFCATPEDGFEILWTITANMLMANQAVVKRIATTLERQRKLNPSELRALLRGLIVTPPKTPLEPRKAILND